MGRAQKTEAEHKLNGTPVKVSGVSSVAPGRPKFPSHLSIAARAEYKRACRLLEQRGTLTPGDFAALSVYAEVFSRWIEAKGELNAKGLMVTIIVLDNNGAPHQRRVKNPCYEIAVASERQILALVKSLGLTPVDKDKPKPAKIDKPEDTIEDFLDRAPGPVLMMPVRHELDKEPE